MIRELRLPAIRIQQGQDRSVYSFAVDGKDLHSFATVSRVARDSETKVKGYQRPEVIAHVGSIRAYLESASPMIPNALVVAFDERVTFEPYDLNGHVPTGQHGVIVIPVDDEAAESAKPGWIVDGQQRAAALRDARIESFPVFVSAFVTHNQSEQRSQFILVNSTKPLPKGLIHELLPTTEGHLPAHLRRRRLPAYLLERLNYDEDSELRLKIRTPTQPGGVIKDNSILKMLENSLTDGALYRYRDPQTGEGDVEEMLNVLKAFWEAVDLIFGSAQRGGAWNLPPRRSRLVHGVGIASLGFVMDAVAEDVEGTRDEMVGTFASVLDGLAPHCAWTAGYWEFGPDDRRKWNELQNTPRDIQFLASYLLRTLASQRPVSS